MKSITAAKNTLLPVTVVLTALWAPGSQALLIDSFDTAASVGVTSAAPGFNSVFTFDSGASMIGDRTLTVNKTAGAAGGANGAYMDATGASNGGLLAMANGNSTNSIATALWTFGLTDLTEGNVNTGLFLVLPAPNDNDLTIGFSLNGGTLYEQIFPNGSLGSAFFFSFSNFADPGAATAATSLLVQFSGSNAWDAEIDYIATFAPPPPPPPPPTPDPPPPSPVPAPTPLALLGLGIAGLGWSRRNRPS